MASFSSPVRYGHGGARCSCAPAGGEFDSVETFTLRALGRRGACVYSSSHVNAKETNLQKGSCCLQRSNITSGEEGLFPAPTI